MSMQLVKRLADDEACSGAVCHLLRCELEQAANLVFSADGHVARMFTAVAIMFAPRGLAVNSWRDARDHSA